MADSRDPGLKVVTILRGDALRDAQRPATPASRTALQGDRTEASAQRPALPEPRGETATIYGVPVSAVQACCGRGCKHCRIYWHKSKS